MPGACQTTGAGDTACSVPWADDARAETKTRLLEFVAGKRDGANLPYIVRTVFERDTDMAGADAQVARRFFQNYPDLFVTTQRDGFTWVEPTLAALHLNRSKHSAKNTDGNGVNPSTGGSRDRYARERAESYLSKHTMIDADSIRADLFGEQATELESIADTWNILERERGSGPEYIGIPYETRFSSLDRAMNIRDGFTDALNQAAGERAVLLEVTTDPKLHDSTLDAADSLLETKNRFMSWLSSTPKAPQIDSRPDNLYVLEWTDGGLPHLHILLFGVNWVASQEALSNYWGQRQGRILNVRGVRKRDDRWLIRDGDSRVSARQYLGKSMRLLCDLASMNPANVLYAADQIRAGNRSDDLWKLALYWASGKQFWNGTPGLKDAQTPDEGLPHVTRYRYIGTARYDQIPAHVRQRTTFFTGNSGLPPPDAAGSPRAAPAD